MNPSHHNSDWEQDSLFGSPPPSPARGRSPCQQTLVAGETGTIVAAPSAGAARKNVGTIALPGSHMSCAELPADLPASRLSPSRPTSSHDLPSLPPSNITRTPTLVHAPVVTSRSSTRSVSSRASSAGSAASFASTSTRKRRIPKSKSATPIPSAPITLPGPHEPTPPNFLRSQSSLLGLAGVVGCVKPAQLHTNDSRPIQPRSYTPIRGSTSTHPIVIDDDQGPRVGRHSIGQLQMPQYLDQLDPGLFRSNIASSLTKEKNLFPVLESLIKLLGGEPRFTPVNHLPQPFARPYGHGIFNAQSSTPILSSDPGGSTTTLPKRRKLRHVPAGAADWDIPFPFAAGEGPETYRDTWAQDRAKQLLTQLLELVQDAAKRAAIKTAKSGGKSSEGRTSARTRRSSRSASVDTQIGQDGLARSNVCESPSYTFPDVGTAMTGTVMDGVGHHLGSLEVPSTVCSSALGSRDILSVGSESVDEEAAVPCDYSAFEEWLSQLLPPETNTNTPPELDWTLGPSAPLDSPASGPPTNSPVPATGDELIDPALLAISQQSGSVPQSQSSASPTSTVTPGDTSQVLDISPTPPALSQSPRSSLSSLTEPLTPLSEAFTDVPASMIAHQDHVRDPSTHPLVEKDRPLQAGNPIQAAVSSPPTEPNELPRITAAQKGKARADGDVVPTALSSSGRSTSSSVSTSKGTLDKQAIVERARERRRQLVAEIERAKMEIWETAIENAVLVHLTRGASS